MTLPNQLVVVDDTDSRINYSGAWSLEPAGEKDGSVWADGFGPTWNRTLHRAAGPQQTASLTFPFQGSAFSVMGTYRLNETHSLPSWTCTVDGASVPTPTLLSGLRNQATLCANATEAGDHVLTVDVTFPVGGEFWLDYILFAPLVPPTENEVVRYSSQSEALNLEPEESSEELYSATPQATLVNSTMVMDFRGTEISVFGTLSEVAPSNATYTIDDGIPVPFTLKPKPSNLETSQHQELVKVTGLSSAHHRLLVAFDGALLTNPLSIDYVHVQLPSSTAAALSIPTPSGIDTTSTSKVNAGVVLGVASGIGIALAIIGIILYRWYRRRNQELKSASDTSSLETSVPPRPVVPVVQVPSSSLSTTLHDKQREDLHHYRTQVQWRPASFLLRGDRPPTYTPH